MRKGAASKQFGKGTWVRHLRGRDDQPLLIRPVAPDDKPLFVAFLKKVIPEDMRLKFFGAVNFNEAAIVQITNVDFAQGMAFVLICETSGEMLGFAKLHRVGNSAEFAILIRSDLKNHGFGWLLMQAITDYAQVQGLKEIEGEVLACNANMLRMCGELGFTITSCPEDSKVKLVRLSLKQPADVVGSKELPFVR